MVNEKADELGVYMPLVKGLYAIIYQDMPVKEIASRLMSGDLAEDVEFMSVGM